MAATTQRNGQVDNKMAAASPRHCQDEEQDRCCFAGKLSGRGARWLLLRREMVRLTIRWLLLLRDIVRMRSKMAATSQSNCQVDNKLAATSPKNFQYEE